MRVAIVDYGMGNLGSVRRALAELGADPYIADSPRQLHSAQRIVLPGVGSFAEGMSNLSASNWAEEVCRQVNDVGKPLLGICLGMQLLATWGTEGGSTEGLNIIPGRVERLDFLGCDFRIPHVGWNSISVKEEATLLSGIPQGTDFYFVHSYAFQVENQQDAIAYTDYGIPVVAAVRRGNAFGTQFHPEKSSRAGFRVLLNFLRS